MARPSKYTEEIGTAICEAIASGVPERIAAQAAGVDVSTMVRWKSRKTAFCAAIKRARAKSVAVRVARIERAARGGDEVEVTEKTITYPDGKVETHVTKKKAAPQWTADAWYLERQFSEHFAQNKIELKEFIRLLKDGKNVK